MKILIVQTSFLGDTILSTPVIAGVRHLYPQAELWLMTTPLAASLVKRDPLLAGVLPFDKRGRDRGPGGLLRMARRLRGMAFDRAYALQRSTRTTLLLFLARIPHRTGFANARLPFLYHHTQKRDLREHDVLRNLSLLAGECDRNLLDTELRLFAPDRGDLPPDLAGRLAPPGRYAVMVPGSAWVTKRWHAQGFREVAQHLLSSGMPVVLLGSPAEKTVSHEVAGDLDLIDLTGTIPLDHSLHLIRQSALMVCNDSMALHVASAFKVPCVVLFCATSPAFGFGPWQNRAKVVERDDLGCKPCRRHGSKACPNGTEACMRDLPATRVIRAIREVLEP